MGIMILRGICHGYREPVKSLWNVQTGRPVFTATMSSARFEFLLQVLRFDDKITGSQRMASDNFAAMRQIFDMSNVRCRGNCNLSERETVDETLRKFRGRCQFKVYMLQKPGKYGMLFRVLTDMSQECFHTQEKQPPTVPNLHSLQEQLSIIFVSLCLVQAETLPWAISVDLAEDLLSHKLTIVGTVNANRIHPPEELKNIE